MKNQEKEAYNRGCSAYWAGEGAGTCPYQDDTRRHAWTWGWLDGCFNGLPARRLPSNRQSQEH